MFFWLATRIVDIMYNPMQTQKGDRIRIQSFHRVYGRKHILRATSQGPILGALGAHDALVHYTGGILSLDAIQKEKPETVRCNNESCKHFCKLLKLSIDAPNFINYHANDYHA